MLDVVLPQRSVVVLVFVHVYHPVCIHIRIHIQHLDTSVLVCLPAFSPDLSLPVSSLPWESVHNTVPYC